MDAAEQVWPELRPGSVLGGKYLLVRHVGVGGMGQVWVARNASTGADVAVKLLLPERAASAEALARFRREAHATAQLTHRGIIRVFDLLELDASQGSLIMVMELLRGHTLAEELHAAGRLGVDETMEIVLPLLSALQHAHGVGIVHRDLKPENVFLAREPDGEVIPKLLDFGISKVRNPRLDAITADGELVGTPCYMSPEQARGKASVDARSDVFSMGILLYEMLSGRNPFMLDDVESLHAVVMAILDHDPQPLPNVSISLWAVIARALAKNRDDRYASVSELAHALRAAVPGYELRGDSRPGVSCPSVAPTVTRATPLETGATVPALRSTATTTRRRTVRALATLAAAAAAAAMAVLGGAARVRAQTAASPSTAYAATHAKELRVDLTRLAAPSSSAHAVAPSATVVNVVPAAYASAPRAAPPPPQHRVVLARDPGF